MSLGQPQWDDEKPIFNKDHYSLTIITNGKTISGQFPDEWLEDYLGQVGNEKVNSVLREFIEKF